MNRREFLKTAGGWAVLAAGASASAQDGGAETPAPEAPRPIELLKPQSDGGKSVLAALTERKTTRAISDRKLPPQVLSNLLWAAFGVNRENGPGGSVGRTAASASNSQEIDVYAVLPEGVYLYEAVGHRLTPVLAGDHRNDVDRRRRRSGATAPLRLVYVADVARFAKARFQEPGLKDPETQKSYYNIDAGLIAGNVYLFAASQGLAAWFHNCDKQGLARAWKLRADQHVLYAQTVGYPA